MRRDKDVMERQAAWGKIKGETQGEIEKYMKRFKRIKITVDE